MQDDDKQPSYERLDETNPEHNRRSFFDWLRGKEESDEERLRKKLDEELKAAARERAEQFEEERRVEERREVAETKKLKKRWRSKLVEKSRQLLEDVPRRGDEPTNGFEVAKLMVAERIVTIHDMLSDESFDLRRSEVKSLKIQIDFMGLLSEKLDRPELEVPEEIEQLYRTVAASVEETTGETPPETPKPQPETIPVSEADAAYTTFASSIVNAISRAMRRENTGTEDTGGKDGSMPTTPEQPRTPVATAPKQAGNLSGPEPVKPAVLTEQLLSIVKGAALSGEAIRKELSQTEHARRLADVVEKATMIDRYIPVVKAKPGSAVSARATAETPAIEKSAELSPNKKIKYMTELELVTLAKTVEIGSGRLLSDAYSKGELDREGLIKVLEKHHKGQDYRSEFTFRREKWRQHKALSPEYLAQPPAPAAPTPRTTTNPDQSLRERSKQRAKALGRRITLLTLPSRTNPTPQHANRRILTKPVVLNSNATRKAAQVAREIRERLGRQGQMALLFVSLLLLVILVVAALELNGR